MSKVPCKQCGLQITEVTARINDGVCMLCKKNALECTRCGNRVLNAARGPSGPLCQSCRVALEMERPKITTFDVDRLLHVCISSITRFVAEHSNETFYAFAVDADMLCLNSEEKFAVCLEEYRSKNPHYYASSKAVQELKMNTGDWAYQGFSKLEEKDGFCSDLYHEHYDQHAIRETSTEYSRSMTQLLKQIEQSGVLLQLRRTEDFTVFLAEHNY